MVGGRVGTALDLDAALKLLLGDASPQLHFNWFLRVGRHGSGRWLSAHRTRFLSPRGLRPPGGPARALHGPLISLLGSGCTVPARGCLERLITESLTVESFLGFGAGRGHLRSEGKPRGPRGAWARIGASHAGRAAGFAAFLVLPIRSKDVSRIIGIWFQQVLVLCGYQGGLAEGPGALAAARDGSGALEHGPWRVPHGGRQQGLVVDELVLGWCRELCLGLQGTQARRSGVGLEEDRQKGAARRVGIR